MLTAQKATFYFCRRPEKMVFPKKSRWNMIFLVLLGKMIFLFPKNMILPPEGKWKMIFLKKNTRKYDIFFKNERDDLLQAIHGNMVFSIWYVPRPTCQKKSQRWSYPAKIHLKVIDTFDRHPRKSSNNSLANGHTTSNRRGFDEDIMSIRRRPNFDEFPRHFHVLFRCNFDGRKLHVVSMYFLRCNFVGRKFHVISTYFFQCNFNGRKIHIVSTYFFWCNFDGRCFHVLLSV